MAQHQAPHAKRHGDHNAGERGHQGHDHAAMIAGFRQRFWVSLVLTAPILALSPMIQSLWWATGYNVVAIPLAAGVLYNIGVVLSPAVGAVLMSASTVIVAINAKLMERVRLSSQPQGAAA